MSVYSIGDWVRLAGRAYVVRGFSPMGAGPRRVHLQALNDEDDWIEVDEDANSIEPVLTLNEFGGEGDDDVEP